MVDRRDRAGERRRIRIYLSVGQPVQVSLQVNRVKVKDIYGGWNSSLVVFRLAVHSVAGSILLWGNLPVEGIFPLELTWVQTPFPLKTLSDESINRGLVCAHMHFIARTQRS